jgi:DUF1009 family protein
MKYKVCFIAGSGELPFEALSNFKTHEAFVIVLKESSFDIERIKKLGYNYKIISFTKIGKMMRTVKKRGIQTICFLGSVRKPTFWGLIPDFTGMFLLFKLLSLKFKGDDAVLKTIIHFVEKRGFKIQGLDKLTPTLIMKKDILTKKTPTEKEVRTAEIAFKILENISEYDIGQSVVMQDGVVLGIEAIEGTDALIKRCAELKYKNSKNLPILVKAAKSNQTLKIDMPVIGVETIKNVALAGFSGIFVKAGTSIIVKKDECIELADKENVFIVGF